MMIVKIYNDQLANGNKLFIFKIPKNKNLENSNIQQMNKKHRLECNSKYIKASVQIKKIE